MYQTIEVPAMFTVAQAAKTFHIGRNTIYTAIGTGDLKAYRPNSRSFILSAEDILAWIKRHECKTVYSRSEIRRMNCEKVQNP